MHKTLAGAALALALLTAPPARAEESSGKLLASFLAAYDKVQTYVGRIAVTTNVNGKHQANKYLLALEKPNKTALTVLESPSQRGAVGTKIVWHGGANCDVKTRFFGFPLALSPRYDDPRLAGARGDNMWDLSVANAVLMTRDPRTRFKPLREETLMGRRMHVVEIRSPKLLKGIDYEVLWLDDALRLPFARDMVQDGQVVYHVEVETFKFDTVLPANTFSLD
jgi:outer membrane lipoprotein-sorting protein